MPCDELEKLRATLRLLQGQLKESSKKSAAAEAGDRREELRHLHGSHSVNFLKRRVERATAAIEQHVAKHGCEQPH